MNEEDFNRRLRELIGEIVQLSEEDQEKLKPMIEETKERHQQIKNMTAKLQETLLHLRIGIKYLIFDLEATRRERDQLKKQLGLDEDPPNKAEGEM